MAKILITGGSGAIGSRLIPKLKANGHEVVVIGRSKHLELGVDSYIWDLAYGTMNEAALRDVTHIIHLAGAGIADKPWSPSRKQEIVESRVKPLEMLANVLKKRNQRIKAIISSSAVGFYGAKTLETIFTEEDKPAADFLGTTCKMWEDGVQFFKAVADREVRIRTGVVLMNGSGALPKLIAPVKYGFGTAIGSGSQWMPWIHIDDLVAIYLEAVENVNMNGPYNAAAPEHINQANFIRKAGRALDRSVFLPAIPKFLVKAVLGDMSKVVTEGSRVSSQKLIDQGFEFSFPHLQPALNQLLK